MIRAGAQTPVSWWEGEGNLLDSVNTNNGYLGVTNEPPAFTFGAGHGGQGFLALGGFAYVPSSTNLQPDQITVQAWLKSAGRGPYQYIVSKDGYQLRAGSAGGVNFINNSDDASGSPEAPSGQIWDGAWHLVTGVFDGENHIYVDGVEVGSGGTGASPMVYGDAPLFFAAYDSAGEYFWQGALDDIKIFDSALAPSQVLSNYLQGLGGTLVGWWRAEDNANDVTGTNNGSVVGAVTYQNSKFAGKAFNTSSGVVVVPDGAALRPAAVTVEAFVQATSPGANKYLLSKSSTSSSASYAFYTGPAGGLVFYVTTPGGKVESPAIAASAIWDGAFHAIAGSYDGHTVRVYLDGFEVGAGTAGSGSIQYGTSQSAGELLFGDFSDAVSSANFAGAIDDVKIYSAARSLQDIRADYSSGIALLAQPQSQTVQPGSNYTLSVTAYGPPPVAYQWRHNGTNLPGETGSSLALNNLQPEQLGSYDVQMKGGGLHFITDVASGLIGQAMDMSNGGEIVVPTSASLEPATVTVQCWVRLNGNPGPYIYLVSKSLQAGQSAYAISTGDTADQGINFYVTGVGGTYLSQIVGDNSMWDGNWHQITGTWDGQTSSIYVDGTLKLVGTLADSPTDIDYSQNSYNGDLIVGDFDETATTFKYPGALDEVKIWDHALTETEVMDTYTNAYGATATGSGLISWYKGDGNGLDSAGTNSGRVIPPATSLVSDVAVLTPVAPVFTNITVSGGNFQALLTGPTGMACVVERSSSLSSPTWVPVVTNTVPFTFIDPAPVNTQPNRFYRAVTQ